MDLGLRDRVAAVTGGSQGIGFATARVLSKEGAKVAVCARRTDVLEEAADAIRRETGGEVLSVPADVTKQEDCERFVAETVSNIKTAQGERSWREQGRPGTLEEYWREQGKGVLVGRMGEPEEAADLIAFLVSERGSFITGTAVNIDGGNAQAV